MQEPKTHWQASGLAPTPATAETKNYTCKIQIKLRLIFYHKVDNKRDVRGTLKTDFSGNIRNRFTLV